MPRRGLAVFGRIPRRLTRPLFPCSVLPAVSPLVARTRPLPVQSVARFRAFGSSPCPVLPRFTGILRILTSVGLFALSGPAATITLRLVGMSRRGGRLRALRFGTGVSPVLLAGTAGLSARCLPWRLFPTGVFRFLPAPRFLVRRQTATTSIATRIRLRRNVPASRSIFTGRIFRAFCVLHVLKQTFKCLAIVQRLATSFLPAGIPRAIARLCRRVASLRRIRSRGALINTVPRAARTGALPRCRIAWLTTGRAVRRAGIAAVTLVAPLLTAALRAR